MANTAVVSLDGHPWRIHNIMANVRTDWGTALTVTWIIQAVVWVFWFFSIGFAIFQRNSEDVILASVFSGLVGVFMAWDVAYYVTSRSIDNHVAVIEADPFACTQMYDSFIADRNTATDRDLHKVWLGAILTLQEHAIQNKELAGEDKSGPMSPIFGDVATTQVVLLNRLWQDYRYYRPVLLAPVEYISKSGIKAATEAMTIAVQDSLRLTQECYKLHVKKYRSPQHSQILLTELEKLQSALAAYDQISPSDRQLEAGELEVREAFDNLIEDIKDDVEEAIKNDPEDGPEEEPKSPYDV